MPEIKKKFRAACESSGCHQDEMFYGTQAECLRLAKEHGWLIAPDQRLCPACHLLRKKADMINSPLANKPDDQIDWKAAFLAQQDANIDLANQNDQLMQLDHAHQKFMQVVAAEFGCLPSFANPHPQSGNKHIIDQIHAFKSQSELNSQTRNAFIKEHWQEYENMLIKLQLTPREVLINIDDFAEQLALRIAESDTDTMELLDVQTVTADETGKLLSVDLSQKGIDIMVNFAKEILEDYIFDRIHNGTTEHGLHRDHDAKLKGVLLEFIDAFPATSTPRQTRVKIDAMKALGWQETPTGFKDPRKSASIDCVCCKGTGNDSLYLQCYACGGSGEQKADQPKQQGEKP